MGYQIKPDGVIKCDTIAEVIALLNHGRPRHIRPSINKHKIHKMLSDTTSLCFMLRISFINDPRRVLLTTDLKSITCQTCLSLIAKEDKRHAK